VGLEPLVLGQGAGDVAVADRLEQVAQRRDR
jgi:hypothetical protein